MIDKVFPRKLNSSKDARVRGKDEMIDAVNVTIDDNYDEVKGDGGTGNFGVLKPIKGNVAVPNDSVDFSGNGRVIGSCVDERNNKIYYFLFSSVNTEQGIYEYDDKENKIKKLIASKYFNFRPNSFVQADVVHIPRGEDSIGSFIFFTDGYNEPRKIDVSRASEGEALSGVDSLAFFDFISVCSRTPMDPPTASFQNDPNSKVSNFRGEKGFQFAYQNIYKSGDVSALSTYSELYVPSAYINQGTAPNPSFFTENYLGVVIPKESVGQEVERVRVLVREGNLGNWFIVDEIDNSTPDADIQLSFYNDSILNILPEAEARRQFNSSPKTALAQTITNNRLFYGNYKEGFTAPSIQANITAEYLARPTDFITFDLTLEPEIRNVNQSIGLDIQNKVSAYRLDTSNIPATTPSNTQVIFNITLSPDKNFHFYEARKGYHATLENNVLSTDGISTYDQVQVKTQQVSSDFNDIGSSYFSTATSDFSIYQAPNQQSLTRSSISENPYTGDHLTWESEFTNEEPFNVVCGTNAANPFIIEGKPLQFNGSFVTRLELSREKISDIIADMMIGNYGRESALFNSGVDAAGNPVSIPTVDILSANNESEYTINLSINNLDKLSVLGTTDPRAKLVNAVGKRSQLTSIGGTKWLPPCGFFIVNYAKPRFRMRDLSLQYELSAYENDGDHFFCLDLVDLGNFDTMTCVPDVFLGQDQDTDIPADKNLFKGWVCMTASYIKYQLPDISLSSLNQVFDYNADNIYSIIQNGFSNPAFAPVEDQSGESVPGALPYYTQMPLNKIDLAEAQISRWLGSIGAAGAERLQVSLPDGTLETIYRGGRLINTFTNFAQDAELNDNVSIYEDRNSFFSYAFTIVDGDGGAGSIDSEGSALGQQRSSIGYWSIVGGISPWFDPAGPDSNYLDSTSARQTVSDFNNMPRISQTDGLKLADYSDFGGDVGSASKVEIADFETIYLSQSVGATASRSFKRKATHSFGIVFYDQRGRASDVIPIGSAYVQDYMNSPKQGPVEMLIDLTNATPPSWAWHYQIVYGGNSTVGDFVQYSAGGAFVEFDPDDEIDDGNIYVSLNYLQENSNVSYSKAFGVTKYDGNKDFYTYKEGDKLRVVSYYTDNDTVQYPPAYEFDVVGTVTLADDDSNPLINPDEEAPKACTGQFVILRNNRSATGFNYQSIKSGSADGPAVNTKSHYWNNRCIFELYSPLKNQEVEGRVYYEISKKYNVIRDSVTQNYDWEVSAVRLSRGDVYFRRVAVNIPRYDSSEQLFLNIITNNDNNAPRFLDYFLETQTFTDSIIGANQLDWGKPKIINNYQREVKRDSSITFSDVNNYALPTLRYCLFDATTSNYKDLPNTHGSIQRLIDRGDSVFVVQEEKSSDIPVSRTLISDASGTDIVVASEKVLGNQVFYSGDYGCSDNPESVTKIGENIYFANKDKREVYKFNPSNGVAVISEYGVKAYFKALFDEVISKTQSVGKPRIVGGYDPLLDEFIITAYNQVSMSFNGVVTIDQDSGVTVTEFNPEDYAGITQEELDALLAENASLITELGEAQLDIDDLQQQIAELYSQIGDVINDPTVDINDAQDIIADLQGEIDELNTTIDSNYGFMANQISQSVDAHRAAKIAAENEVINSESFIAEINNATDGDGVNRYANDLYLLPATIEGQFTSPLSVSAGEEVDYTTYLAVLQNIVNEIKRYRSNDIAPGEYDETIGIFTDRQGVETTFPIGYGIPTDDSLTDADDTSPLPVGSALYNDGDFLAKLLGIEGPSGTTYVGYLAQAQSMTQFFGIEALGDLGGRIDNLVIQTYELELDKQELLDQIAGMIDGIYQSRGPSIDKPEQLGTDLYPFGVSYIDGDGNEVSPFAALRDANIADAGDPTRPNLRTYLESNPITQQFIIDSIEGGILGYRSDYQAEYDGAISDIDAIRITRDALATTAYGGIKNVYQVSTFLNNGVAPVPKVSGNTIPVALFPLLVNGTATPQQIIATLSGSTTDADGNLVSTVNNLDVTYGDIYTQFEDIFSNISDLIALADGGTPAQTGTGELTPELKSAIGGLLNGIKDQISNATTLSFSFPALTALADAEATSEEVTGQINAWASAILGASEGDDGTLFSQLQTLQNLLLQAADPIIVNSFFDASSYTNSNPNDSLLAAIANPNPSVGPFVSEAYTLLGEVNTALSALKDFQILFGTAGSNPGNPYIVQGAAFPTASIIEQSDTYGVGYTGIGGAGLTAKKLVEGNNISTNNGALTYSSYVGLQNALDFITERAVYFSNNQVGDGTLYFGETYAQQLIGYDQTPIIFNGNAGDLLSPAAYANLYSVIEAAVTDSIPDPEPTVTANTVAGIASDVLNAAINNTIGNYGKGLSTFKTKRGTGLPAYLHDVYNNVTESGGTAGDAMNEVFSYIDFTNTRKGDINQDGQVSTADLLEFLTEFNQPATVVAPFGEVTSSKLNEFADQFKYTSATPITISAPEGNRPSVATDNSAFVGNLLASLNSSLSTALPAGEVVQFDYNTGQFFIGPVN